MPTSTQTSRPDMASLLNHFVHTVAFCLSISALMFFFASGTHASSYAHPLVYSLAIGIITWAIIDIGRFVLPLDPDSGWPRGFGGIFIVALGITVGFVGGTFIGDSIIGQSSWKDLPRSDLRMSWIITILAGVAGSIYFYSRSRDARQQARIQLAQRAVAEAKLKLLETQLEPHMLFNTLANLRVLIATDAPRAQDMLDRLIAYLRATLSASRVLAHPLSSEFARLDDYLQLMAVRMGERLRYTLTLPQDLQSITVPPLLLQPLVENAIKHGLEPSLEGGEIRVSATREGMRLRLDVEDTGVGMPAFAASTSGAGFGLSQVRERLAAAYEGNALFEVVAGLESGTHIILRLPIGMDTLDATTEAA
ncbi:sensor histidine kinase [Variovorax sp. VNK109]|uniref:sensor histidine kinase n=1 Tax=Variovorax sp. VNK109 TaxID=3400919 RepID=UPI003BFC2C0A